MPCRAALEDLPGPPLPRAQDRRDQDPAGCQPLPAPGLPASTQPALHEATCEARAGLLCAQGQEGGGLPGIERRHGGLPQVAPLEGQGGAKGSAADFSSPPSGGEEGPPGEDISTSAKVRTFLFRLYTHPTTHVFTQFEVRREG